MKLNVNDPFYDKCTGTFVVTQRDLVNLASHVTKWLQERCSNLIENSLANIFSTNGHLIKADIDVFVVKIKKVFCCWMSQFKNFFSAKYRKKFKPLIFALF
jgi:hypothetical protein